MAANADDIIAAMDRLAKALEAQDARKERDKAEREERSKARAEEKEARERRIRDDKAERQRDDEEQTFDPATTLGKVEGAYKKYRQVRDTIRDVKATAEEDHPFGGLGKVGKMFGGGGAAEGAGGAAEAAGAAGGVASGVLAAVVLVWEYSKALFKFKEHVEKATDALVQLQKGLADASPSMAAVMARRDFQELMRERKRGEALSDSAEYLTGAEQRRKDATLPVEVMWTEFKNRVYGFGNDMVGGMAQVVNGVLGLTEKFDDGQAPTLAESVKRVQDAEQKRMENERARLDRIKEQAGKGRRFG